MSGWWCIMPTWWSRTQNSTSPSILAHFSSHGYQKVAEFTSGLENAVRLEVRSTESTTTINQRSKVNYTFWLLLLLLGCSMPWGCHGLQVHPSSRVVCRSIHEGHYVLSNAGWLAGWLAVLYRCIHLQQGSCLAGGASCQLGGHAHKTVPLHQYWPISQATGIKKY